MYSLVLMVAMTGQADNPQGIIRGSCNGQPSAVAAVVGGIRTRFAERRRPLLRPAAKTFVPQTYGCAGSSYSQMPVGDGPSVAAVGEGPVRRAVVRAQLRIALSKAQSTAGLTPSQKTAALKALSDSDIFDAAAAKTRVDLSRGVMKASGGEQIGALGDGTILRLLIDNLPAILDTIERLIKLFSITHDVEVGSGRRMSPEPLYWTAV